MLKKIFTDWSLWILVVFNLYLLDYYTKHPSEVITVIFLYWAQSVLIGIVNFFDILTVPNSKPMPVYINGQLSKKSFGGTGCFALFFLFHYGAFHLAYIIFILIKIHGTIDFSFVKIALGILACNLVLDFIKSKLHQRENELNVGKMFIMPYARIVPMHLMIILPEFFGVSNFTVFIVLKIVMDLIMHFALSKHYKRSINNDTTTS